jgi:hypothetical protein
MRFRCLLFSLSVLCGVSFAQDTNFSTGPQYLMNYGSPLFLHSIETPSLSLQPSLTPVTTEPPAEAQPVPAPIGSEVPNLFSVYYGPPPETLSEASASSEIEISSPNTPVKLPASFFDVGVIETTSPQSLRGLGYGMEVGEAAAFWKAHKPGASRTFTNADIERLHRS